ncbi:MAG: DNA polymerase III subunit delta' [Calditrichales bacterium]|nr:MAG: DNA polymerase III subunit delta' [Calditrichales bacterium]
MEYFKGMIIQKTVRERFENAFTNDRLAHAYLFYGPEGSGKEATALAVAKVVNCQHPGRKPCNECLSCEKISQIQHPDVKFVIPEGKTWTTKDLQKKYKQKVENPYSGIVYTGPTSISIDRIRLLKDEAKFAPYEGQKKVYILTEVDQMSRPSANSFLKLLEEPPENLMIIMITNSLDKLLDTIRSRCQLVYFPAFTSEEAFAILRLYKNQDAEGDKTARIAQGNLKKIFELSEQGPDEKRHVVYDYLKAAASGNALTLQEVVDLIHKERDKKFLLDVLNLLTLWFKDTIHLVSVGDEAPIINVDFEDEIHRFAKSYAPSDFDQIVSEIENAIAAVGNNVYAPIILTVLAIQIKKHLKRLKG